MIDVLSRQRVYPEVLLPFLQRIEYDEATKMARRWLIADQVVIDPAIGLGKPIIDGIGIATAVLAALYEANDQNAELVADWFRAHPKHVIAAVDFERILRRTRFFFDRNIPPQLARMVDVLEREHTARSYYDDGRFTDTTSDVEWIKVLAADDPPWIIITGDGESSGTKPNSRH